jgi:hypothetical protein
MIIRRTTRNLLVWLVTKPNRVACDAQDPVPCWIAGTAGVSGPTDQ